MMTRALLSRGVTPASGWLLCALALGGLSGCADFWAARERRALGWREAQVVQIDIGARIARDSDKDCRKDVDPDTAARGVFVVYRYRGANHYRYWIGPRFEHAPLKVGDRVFVNINGCQLPPMPIPKL